MQPPAVAQDNAYKSNQSAFKPLRVLKACRSEAGLVHGVAAAGHSVETYRRVELGQFSLELLVDPQQGLERAADIAIAARHDLIDGGFACV